MSHLKNSLNEDSSMASESLNVSTYKKLHYALKSYVKAMHPPKFLKKPSILLLCKKSLKYALMLTVVIIILLLIIFLFSLLSKLITHYGSAFVIF